MTGGRAGCPLSSWRHLCRGLLLTIRDLSIDNNNNYDKKKDLPLPISFPFRDQIFRIPLHVLYWRLSFIKKKEKKIIMPLHGDGRRGRKIVSRLDGFLSLSTRRGTLYGDRWIWWTTHRLFGFAAVSRGNTGHFTTDFLLYSLTLGNLKGMINYD